MRSARLWSNAFIALSLGSLFLFLGWPLGVAIVHLAFSMFFWNTSKPGGLLCGTFPGHALWHVGMGITVTSFALHAARDAATRLQR